MICACIPNYVWTPFHGWVGFVGREEGEGVRGGRSERGRKQGSEGEREGGREVGREGGREGGTLTSSN